MGLCNRGIKIPASATFEKFVGMDNAAEPCAEFMDNDTVREMYGNSNSELEAGAASEAGVAAMPSETGLFANLQCFRQCITKT